MSSAMENNGNRDEMDERRLLAPWHVTGQLSAEEAIELEALFHQDPEFAKLLEEAEKEAQATVALNEAQGSPSQEVWARLERSIDTQAAHSKTQASTGFLTGMRSGIAEFLGGFSKMQWQMAALAAVAICVVQLGTILYLAKPDSKYVIAGGEHQAAPTQAVFLVSFKDTATIAEVSMALDDAGVMIVSGPDSAGIYHLGLRNAKLGPKDKSDILRKLQTYPAVQQILPEK